MKFITTTTELAAFCKAAEKHDFITVDTEFMRDKTYFPKLCLLQLATPDSEAIVDPLADGLDLAPVFDLLQNPKVTKVFHACRQDIEIFYLLSGKTPAPIFDSQIAAAVCGYGESVSYETLVNKIVGADIDKSSRFSDWSARPLTEQQLNYAISDVTHLRVIYANLKEQIEKAGRTSWIEEEHAFLTDPALYQLEPQDAWQRLKFGNMRPKNLAVLRELAAWREIEARKSNVPRGRIIKDDALMELAIIAPKKESDLARMRGERVSKNKMEAVLAAVATALALPTTDYPQVARSKKPSENITSARGRLVDADFAKETAAMARANILQQAGTAMLAQANALPQQVLQLLRGG
ncbi:MAG: ribonuclease D [Alphaproteobacteria bacterium]|nr:ribonuclease D [Alphaproteobacteria bacterium]